MLVEALVLFNFHPENKDELKASRGDRITVLTQVNKDWLMAQKDSEVGIIPANFVSIIPSTYTSTHPSLMLIPPPPSDLPPSPTISSCNTPEPPNDLPPPLPSVHYSTVKSSSSLPAVSSAHPPKSPFMYNSRLSRSNRPLSIITSPTKQSQNSPHDGPLSAPAAQNAFRSAEEQSKVTRSKKFSAFLSMHDIVGNFTPPAATHEFWCTFADGVFKCYISLVENTPLFEFRKQEILAVDRVPPLAGSSSSDFYSLIIDLKPGHQISHLRLSCNKENVIEPLLQLLRDGPRRFQDTAKLVKLSVDTSVNDRKEGWLKKYSSGFSEKKKRYVQVDQGMFTYYKSEHDISKNNWLHRIDLLTCSVKTDPVSTQKFGLITPQRSYWFLCGSSEDCKQWVHVIQSNIAWKIGLMSPSKDSPSSGNRSRNSSTIETIEGGSSVLAHLRSVPGNDICADCDARDPEWASINLGVLVCITCSGVHRSLGVHISKVRSLKLDDWEPAVIDVLSSIGNSKFNQIYEGNLYLTTKPTQNDDRVFKESFIRDKYVNKKFLSSLSISNRSDIDFDDPISVSLLLMENCSKNEENVVIECMELLAKGADINFEHDPQSDPIFSKPEGITLPAGTTPIHCAALHGNVILTQWLLLNGADVTKRNSDGKEVSEITDDVEIKEIIRRYSPKNLSAPLNYGDADDYASVGGNFQIYIAGWLVKANGKDGSKGWSKRFFKFECDDSMYFKKGVLKYYRSENQSDENGSIPLDDVLDVRILSKKYSEIAEWPFVFEVHTWTRVYTLAAHNPREQAKWLEFFNDLISLKKDMKSKKSASGSISLKRNKSIQSKEDVVPRRVFSIDLAACAERRQGSRERGIPLFISKCIGFYHQLFDNALGELENSDASVLTMIYSRTINWDQSEIMATVKHLKSGFDSNDELIDLPLEFQSFLDLYGHKTMLSMGQIMFLRGLTLLMLHYFSSIPRPLVTTPFFDQFTQIISHLKSLAQEAYITDVDIDPVKSIPPHILYRLVIPIVHQLPECNYQTLKKIAYHLHHIFALQSTILGENEKYNELRREIGSTWSTPLFGLTQFDLMDENAENHDNRIFFVEILIEHYGTIFGPKGEVLEEDPPQIAPREDFELFPLDVYINNGSIVYSKRIPRVWKVKQLVEDIKLFMREEIKGTSDQFHSYALYEVLPPSMERAITLTETVFDIVQGWETPVDHRLTYKSSPLKVCLVKAQNSRNGRSLFSSTHYNSPAATRGWLFKEGISVKSWKRRYFVLRDDYIYYFKDERCSLQHLVGKLPFRNLGIYICRTKNQNWPSEYCFCIRPVPYKAKELANDKTVSPRFLCAENPNEMYRWVMAIMNASKIVQLKHKNPLEVVGKASIPTPPRITVSSYEEESPINMASINLGSASAPVNESPLQLETSFTKGGLCDG